MKQIFFITFLGFYLITNAQDKSLNKINYNTQVKQDTIVKSIPVNGNEVVNDTIIFTESVTIQNPNTATIINAEANIVSETYINEDLSVLSDNQFAKLVDELWFDEQDNSNLNKKPSEIIYDESELTTNLIKQRLAHLNSQTPFNVEYNEILEQIIKSYVKHKNAKYSKLINKSKYYFPMIEEQLAKYNIPIEMKYLAVVESALNPTAKSPVGAAGLWQFMYQTGKQFDLNVSSYVDERHDAQKATIAACEFLSSLYKTFGDWDLALAAYNSGPGNVTKAIRRAGGSTNYWNIRHHLPRETASYVPIFYATMYMFEFADIHNIKPEADALKFYQVDSLRVKRQITFDQITQAIPIEKNVLRLLNPQYKLEIIPVIKDRDYSLVLPKSLIGEFVQNESRIYSFAEADDAKREKPLPKYTEMNNRIRYKVRKGDYLGKIASKFGVTVSKIKRWNSMKSTNLKIGQRLTIFPRRM